MTTTEVNNAAHWAPTAGMLLVKLGKAAERRFEKALKPSGLTPRHLGVLFEGRPPDEPASADRDDRRRPEQARRPAERSRGRRPDRAQARPGRPPASHRRGLRQGQGP